MKNFIFKTLTIALFLYSCTGKEIQYTGINIPLNQKLQGTLLDSTFIFSVPRGMVIADTLLIVLDYLEQDTSFHVFNKITGKHLKSFGNKGRGPGEVVYPGSLSYNPKDGTLITMESNLKKIIRYNLANILADKPPFFSEIKLNSIPFYVDETILYKDFFIIGGFKKRFSMIDTNCQILGEHNDYPKVVADEDENRAIFLYSSQYAVHPNGDKLVAMTYIGGIMEIFDIKDNKITPNIIKYFHEPIYRPVLDAKPKWIATIEETTPCCSDIYGTDENIYCIYEGEISKDPKIALKKILVFDWNGQLLFQYTPQEGTPVSIAVDEEYIYSIITTPEGEYHLYKYNYKN